MLKYADALDQSQHYSFKRESYEKTKTYKDSINQVSIHEWVNSRNNIFPGLVTEIMG